MEAKLLTLAVVIGFLSVVHTDELKWEVCPDTSKYEGVVAAVATNASITSGEADLKRGTSVEFEVSFKTNVAVTSAVAVVHGIIDGLPVPFPLDNPNACKDCGLTCPLKTGTGYKYTAVIPVKTLYPKVRLVVKWQLKDDKGNQVWCVELPAEIQ